MDNPRFVIRWSWTGVAALILALAVGIGWAIAFTATATSPQPASEAGINMLGSLGSAMTAAVAAYIGFQAGRAKPTSET